MLIPTPKDLFFTKNDIEDPRLGELIKRVQQITDFELKPNEFALLSYPDDEGIKANGGRIGSAEAPRLIKQFLYKMTPSLKAKNQTHRVYDFGDILTRAQDLVFNHLQAVQYALHLHHKRLRVVSLGGGHDYGYPDGAAFIESVLKFNKKTNQNLTPVIFNFDAHLDVRPPKNGTYHSGTPFYRLKKEFNDAFELFEIGIQDQCNSSFHYRWALDQGVEIFTLQEIEETNWSVILEKLKQKNIKPENSVFYISFDMDALKAADAGGCSQSWSTGLSIKETLHFLKYIYSTYNTRGLGLYEVSPPFDKDFQTSKAAALLIHQFLFADHDKEHPFSDPHLKIDQN